MWDFNITEMAQSAPFFKIAISLLIIVSVITIRRLVLKKVKRRDREDRRHIINVIKQASHGIMFIALLMVWASEMQHLAISVAAFMVAIVLAIREFLQCLLGFFYYLFTRPFRAGDWIEINGTTAGEVYSIDWLKVTLLEIEPGSLEYTGKTAYVPNNWLVTRQLKNLNYMRRYTTHTFTLTFDPGCKPLKWLPQIKGILQRHCEPFQEVAQRYKEKIERYMDTEFLCVEPQVMVKTSQLGMVELHFGLFCPTEKAGSLENALTQEVLLLISDTSRRTNNIQLLATV